MATQETLWHIYRIQQLDARLAAVERAKEALDDGAALGREVALRQAEAAALQGELRKARLTVRDAELELATTESRVKKIEQVLYGGKVSNPKELQGYEAELVSLRRRQDHLEDQVLTRMEEHDTLERQAAAAAQVEAAARMRWQERAAAYREERAALDAEKESVAQQREDLRTQADPELLRQYDAALRRRKLLVGRIEHDACGACGMVLPVRMIKEMLLRADAAFSCPTCNALFLWRITEE